MPGWEDAPVVEQPTETPAPAWAAAPEIGFKAKALAYGEIVGEHTPATQVGPAGNKLHWFDAAISPNIEQASGLQLGDWVDVKLDGTSIGKRRFADRSFITEGKPTHNVIELRDQDISGKHVTITPTPPPQSWNEAPVISLDGHEPTEVPEEAAPIELPSETPAPTPAAAAPTAEEEPAETKPIDEGHAKRGFPTLQLPATAPEEPQPTTSPLEIPAVQLPTTEWKPLGYYKGGEGAVEPETAPPEFIQGMTQGLGETVKGFVPTSTEAIKGLATIAGAPSQPGRFLTQAAQAAIADYGLIKAAQAAGPTSKEAGRAAGIIAPQALMELLGVSAPLAGPAKPPIQPRLSAKEIPGAFAGKPPPAARSIEATISTTRTGPVPAYKVGDQIITTPGAGIHAQIELPEPKLGEIAEPGYLTEKGKFIPKFSDDMSENVLPKVNESNGGAKPPPPRSIYGTSDIPPNQDPAVIQAMRAGNKFQEWWRNWWPRTLKVTRVSPDSPVITAHQRLLKSVQDYLQNYTQQDWWKELRAHTDEEIIDLEDRAVKRYQSALQQELSLEGSAADRSVARQKALASLPDWFQKVLNHRQDRIPIEQAAAETLGVEPPKYLGEPYVARLTNQEGKNVYEIHPSKGLGVAGNLRTTLGSFDRSRVFPSMKDGIKNGVQYEPVRRAMLVRELTSAKMEATANFVKTLKDQGVIFDDPREALANSPTGKIAQIKGLGGADYYSRTAEEGKFIEHSVSMSPRSPFGRLQQILNTYVRNPSLINPLPHVTKNMLFKYIMARVNNFTLRRDVAEFKSAEPSALKSRFEKVMPFTEGGERVPQIIAKESGDFAEKAMTRGFKLNNFSSNFIFNKADPAMRYSLWKSYVRKGMSDQEAANHVWLDLVRYDENSGGMSFWKQIPFNFFVPWRVGTYTTIAKAFRAHPVRTLLTIGAIEYLREARYRKSGNWTHLPTDYIDAPLAEIVNQATKVKDWRTARGGAEQVGAVAGSLALFGPGGGQAPTTIKDVMSFLQGDPKEKERVLNMFWGISQMYNLPREFLAYQKDGDQQHLVNLLTTAALSEHAALKYEPRRLMKWLPEWMPGMQKSQLVAQAEAIRARVEARQEKSQLTFESRHGIGASYQFTPSEEQMLELRRAAGARGGGTTKSARASQPPKQKRQYTVVPQHY